MMKKNMFLIMLLAISFSYAQSLPFDFESTQPFVGGDGATVSAIDDNGGKVLQIVGVGAAWDNANVTFASPLNLSDANANTIKFRMKAPGAVEGAVQEHLLKFELPSEGADLEKTFITTGSEWQDIEVDMAKGNQASPTSYGRMVIMVDWGGGPTASESATYLIDDISIGANSVGVDASLSDLQVDGTTVTGFDSDTSTYLVAVPEGTTLVPTITATTTDANATAVITPAGAIPGETLIVVTAANGTTTKTYSVSFGFPIEFPFDFEGSLQGFQEGGNTISNGTGNDVLEIIGEAGGEWDHAKVTFSNPLDLSDNNNNTLRFTIQSTTATEGEVHQHGISFQGGGGSYEVNFQTVGQEVKNIELDFASGLESRESLVIFTDVGDFGGEAPHASGGQNGAGSSAEGGTYIIDNITLGATIIGDTGSSELPFDFEETLHGFVGDQATVSNGTGKDVLEIVGGAGQAWDNVNVSFPSPLDLSDNDNNTLKFTIQSTTAEAGEVHQHGVSFQTDNEVSYEANFQTIGQEELYVELDFEAGLGSRDRMHIFTDVGNFGNSNASGGAKGNDTSGSSGTYIIDNISLGASSAGIDASLSDIKVDGATVSGFDSSITSYLIALPEGTTDVPVVTANTTDANATFVITPAGAIPGDTKIVITAADGTTIKTYSVSFGFPIEFPFDFEGSLQGFMESGNTISNGTGSNVLEIVGGVDAWDSANVSFSTPVDLSDDANNTLRFTIQSTTAADGEVHQHGVSFQGGGGSYEANFQTVGKEVKNVELNFKDGLESREKLFIFTDTEDFGGDAPHATGGENGVNSSELSGTYIIDNITLGATVLTSVGPVVLPFDFETSQPFASGDGAGVSAIDDNGNKVLQIVGNGAQWDNANVTFDDPLDLSDANANTIKFRMKAPGAAAGKVQEHLLKFELPSEGGDLEKTFITTGSDWQDIEVDMAKGNQASPTSYGRMVIMVDWGNGPTKSDIATYLIDDISIGANSVGVDASLSDLQVDGTTVTGFNSDTSTYLVAVPEGTTLVPTITATTTDANATVVITPAGAIPGETLIVVTAANGTTTKTYSVSFGFPIEFPFDFEGSLQGFQEGANTISNGAGNDVLEIIGEAGGEWDHAKVTFSNPVDLSDNNNNTLRFTIQSTTAADGEVHQHGISFQGGGGSYEVNFQTVGQEVKNVQLDFASGLESRESLVIFTDVGDFGGEAPHASGGQNGTNTSALGGTYIIDNITLGATIIGDTGSSELPFNFEATLHGFVGSENSISNGVGNDVLEIIGGAGVDWDNANVSFPTPVDLSDDANNTLKFTIQSTTAEEGEIHQHGVSFQTNNESPYEANFQTIGQDVLNVELDFEAGLGSRDRMHIFTDVGDFGNTNATGGTKGNDTSAKGGTYIIDNITLGATILNIENNKLLGLSLYPNPVSNRLNISAKETIKNADIFNVLGKKVMSLNINKTFESIDVSNLTSGMYLVKYNVNGSVGTAKFIKQ